MSETFRVWNIVNPPARPEYSMEFIDIDLAVSYMNGWAHEQLKNDSIISNVFGIEVFRDGEWEEADEWEHGYSTGWYEKENADG